MKNLNELKEQYKKLGKEIERLEKSGKLPDRWEDIGIISGWYTDSGSDVNSVTEAPTHSNHRNVYKTKEQAEASIAMAQLTQLLVIAHDGWVADWNDYDKKWCIAPCGPNEFTTYCSVDCKRLLHFQSKEKAEEFLRRYRSYIDKARPLL